MDKSNDEELLIYILQSIDLVHKWFTAIESSDDFLQNDAGLMRLDAISMRPRSIGEAIKNIDKRNRNLLLSAADSEYWSKIIKTREILTHHYISIDVETVFEICDTHLDMLENRIETLLRHIQAS